MVQVAVEVTRTTIVLACMFAHCYVIQQSTHVALCIHVYNSYKHAYMCTCIYRNSLIVALCIDARQPTWTYINGRRLGLTMKIFFFTGCSMTYPNSTWISQKPSSILRKWSERTKEQTNVELHDSSSGQARELHQPYTSLITATILLQYHMHVRGYYGINLFKRKLYRSIKWWLVLTKNYNVIK